MARQAKLHPSRFVPGLAREGEQVGFRDVTHRSGGKFKNCCGDLDSRTFWRVSRNVASNDKPTWNMSNGKAKTSAPSSRKSWVLLMIIKRGVGWSSTTFVAPYRSRWRGRFSDGRRAAPAMISGGSSLSFSSSLSYILYYVHGGHGGGAGSNAKDLGLIDEERHPSI